MQGVRVGFAGLLSACTMATAQVGVEAFAPESSYMIMSVPNARAALDALDRSSLRELWDRPSVQAWFKESTEADFGDIRQEMDDLGIDIDDLAPPVGAVGAAYFFVEEFDEDGEAWPMLRILASADFGEHAEDMMDAVWAFLDEWADADLAVVSEDNYRGATIIEIEWTPEPVGELEAPGPTPLDALSMSEHAYIAHLDGFIVFCDEEGIVERAIDASLGDDVTSIDDSKRFQAAVAQHPDDSHALLTFIMSDTMKEFLVETMQMAMGMTLPGLEVTPIMEMLGLLDFQAAGIGLRFDAPDAPVEMTHGLLMADKRGLVSLFDVPGTPFEVPPFISADAAEVMRISVHFDQIFGVADKVVGTLDEQQRAEVRPMLEIAQGMLQPALDELGPEMYIITSYDKPLGVNSQAVLYAIPVGDELIMGNTLTLLSAQMGGMVAARDFEGAVIYEPEGAGVPLAVGTGFGYLLVGAPHAVENAIRRAANPGGASLADEPRFQDAAGMLGRDMVLATYMDMAERLAWTRWQFENELAIFDQMLRDQGYPDDLREQVIAERENQLADRPDLPPVEVLLEVLGDVVSEMRSTEDGFRGRALLLQADD